MLYTKQFSTLTTVTYLLLIIYLTCVELGPGHPPPHSTPFPGKISKLLNSHDSEFPENRPRTHPSPPWKTKLPMAAPPPPPEKNSESAHDLVLFIPCINQRFALHTKI